MNTYKIFKDSQGNIEAVKSGWSWAAFSTWIWALENKMLVFGIITGIIFGTLFPISVIELPGLIKLLPLLFMCSWFGIRGNNWLEIRLLSRGYDHIGTVEAFHPGVAVAMYLKKGIFGRRDKNQDLMNAVQEGNLEKVRTFLDKGADVNAKTYQDFTALMSASFYGHLKIVELLLDSGADIDAKDENDRTALIWASCQGKLEVVSLLKARGADDNKALIEASKECKLEDVKSLLASGADVNAKDDLGNTAMMHASYWGHAEVVEILLDNGADINAKDDLGNTAMILASRKGHLEVEDLLSGKKLPESHSGGKYCLRCRKHDAYSDWQNEIFCPHCKQYIKDVKAEITQTPEDRKQNSTKTKINAKAVVQDIKTGLDDVALMQKYGLSEKQLPVLYKKLKDAGLLKG